MYTSTPVRTRAVVGALVDPPSTSSAGRTEPAGGRLSGDSAQPPDKTRPYTLCIEANRETAGVHTISDTSPVSPRTTVDRNAQSVHLSKSMSLVRTGQWTRASSTSRVICIGPNSLVSLTMSASSSVCPTMASRSVGRQGRKAQGIRDLLLLR